MSGGVTNNYAVVKVLRSKFIDLSCVQIEIYDAGRLATFFWLAVEEKYSIFSVSYSVSAGFSPLCCPYPGDISYYNFHVGRQDIL